MDSTPSLGDGYKRGARRPRCAMQGKLVALMSVLVVAEGPGLTSEMSKAIGVFADM